MFLTASLAFAGQISMFAQTNGGGSDFQEVYDLIRQHASGVSEAELNQAAIKGLVDELSPKVSLVTNESPENAKVELIAKATVFDGGIGYLRIVRVGDGLAKGVQAAYQQMNSTNKIKGVVLDLRYADGTDYAAATATADLFVSKSRPLLDWGKGVVSSHEKKDAISVPVAVLVNHETAGAAEALAAMTRETDAGLILGSPTAGEAMVMQDFPLKNGGHLRIASAPITLGNGVALSAKGVKPDIDVTVSEEAEKAFYADSFLVVKDTNHVAGSNGPAGEMSEGLEPVRLNEAELVREHNAGENPDEQVAKRPPEPHVPVVSDPALARALDLLKGLAVVRQNNS